MSLRTHPGRYSNPTHMRMTEEVGGGTGERGKKSSMERNINWEKGGAQPRHGRQQCFVCKHMWCVFMIAGRRLQMMNVVSTCQEMTQTDGQIKGALSDKDS